MARTEKYFLGPGLLADIRHALLRVDAIAPSTSGLKSDVLLDRLPEKRGGPGMKFGLWTATANWTVMPILSTATTNTNNTQVIRWAFPQETATQGTATVMISTGETALVTNHLVRINKLSTSVTSVIAVIAFKENGSYRLAGAEC